MEVVLGFDECRLAELICLGFSGFIEVGRLTLRFGA